MTISSVFQLASPAALWALLVVPTALLAFNLATRNSLRLQHRLLLSIFLIGGLATGALYLAEPQRAVTFLQRVTPPHAIVGLLDDSGSTEFCFEKADPEDYLCRNSNVFEVFRQEFKTFAQRRQPDKIGLTVFSDTVEVVSRIDEGTDTAIERLENFKLRSGGTYTLDGMRKALDQLRHSKEIGRTLIIMSDGYDQVERRELDSVIDEIKKLRISVYWIRNELDLTEDLRNGMISLRSYGATLLEQAGVKIMRVDDRTQMRAAFSHIDVMEHRINFLSEQVTAITDYTARLVWFPVGLLLSFFSFWLMLSRSPKNA